jgi:hypothetical protein
MSWCCANWHGSPHYVSSFSLICRSCTLKSRVRPKSTHRVAMADFCEHSIKKTALAGEGLGCTPHPLSLYLPSRTKFLCTIQPRGQIHSPYFISTLHVLCGYKTPLKYYTTASPCCQRGRKVDKIACFIHRCNNKMMATPPVFANCKFM